MKAKEFNFDGLVGPTHNYSGLSYGNKASTKSKNLQSNPREAALQGLEKMKFLHDKGIAQALLPPQERPHLPTLRALGFSGSDQKILSDAYKSNPTLFYACCSAACMWTANAATVSPSSDTLDGKLHITPANLSNKFHRSIEAESTYRILQKIFSDSSLFTIHSPLPQGDYFADEGAANHNRLCVDHSKRGIELFVWGRYSLRKNRVLPHCFPARQTWEASESIVRNHQLQNVIFAQQNPLAIDAGVFHNDVISVANEYVYLYHEKAFVNTKTIIRELKSRIENLVFIPVSEREISLKDAVSTYLFNSQIVTLPDHTMHIIAPTECKKNRSVHQFLMNLVQDKTNPISGVDYLDLRQSMANGGGPACLRLRIVLNEEEERAIHPGVILTEELYKKLKKWIEKHYRDRLSPEDLCDPQLLEEIRYGLDELTHILGLGNIYEFQQR